MADFFTAKQSKVYSTLFLERPVSQNKGGGRGVKGKGVGG